MLLGGLKLHLLQVILRPLPPFYKPLGQIERAQDEEEVGPKGPIREVKRWIDLDGEPTDAVAHPSVAIHDLHFQRVGFGPQVRKRHARLPHLRHQPLVAEPPQAIEEPALLGNHDLVAGQQNRECVLFGGQCQFTSIGQSFFQHDSAAVGFAHRQHMVEEHEP